MSAKEEHASDAGDARGGKSRETADRDEPKAGRKTKTGAKPANKADAERGVGLDRGIQFLEHRRDAKADARAEGNLKGQRARGWTEKLLTRTTSGAIYAFVVTACVFLGPLATAVVVAAMAWLCCSEFFRMARMSGRMPNEPVGLTASVLYPLASYFWGVSGLVVVGFALLVAVSVWYVATPRATIGDVSITLFGPAYTSLPLSSMVVARVALPDLAGAELVFGAVLSVWANDALAYFVGSRFGSHKMAPRISPNKSWEGFFGGIVTCVAVWAIMGVLGLHGLGVPYAVWTGVVVGVAGVVGDLFESRIKRGVGVKDSGNIMPGHGGMLDRSDSLIFGMMVALFMFLVGGIV